MKVLSKNNKVLLADGQAVKWQSGGVEQVEWHQCPEAVRNYLENVTYDPNDYSTSQIENYAPTPAVLSNTKPIAETVTGDEHRNEVPNINTPFASTNAAGTLKPLDRLRWINTTSITWVDGVNAFSSVEAANAYIASHPDTPNRTLFRIYPVDPPGTVPNNREFMIYEDGTLKYNRRSGGQSVRFCNGIL